MKILIHATLYPEGVDRKRATTTLFMHYYAAEWALAGHDVLVIHHRVLFPRRMVAIGRRMLNLPVMGKAREFLEGYGDDPDTEFVIDRVPVVRRAMYKLVPRSLFSRRTIARRAALCRTILEKRAFQPDVVVCDFINPGLFVALAMRDTTNAPICTVLHKTCMEYFARGTTAKGALEAVRRADVVAFRSGQAMQKFEDLYFKPARRFILSSGVPKSLARPLEQVRFRSQVRDFLCVGRMTEQKKIGAVIEAFGTANIPESTLTIVGEGIDREALEALAAKQKNARAIRFAGQVPREQVMAMMEACDCFALVSERETFGMAYVEAMSTGAIVIGSEGQGISDLVVDGDNGLLSPAGDAAALAERMIRLSRLPFERVRALSKRAYETTQTLRDDLLAAQAIENLSEAVNRGRLQANADEV